MYKYIKNIIKKLKNKGIKIYPKNKSYKLKIKIL